MEIKVNSSENVRLEVEIEELNDDGSQSSEANFGLREESKIRLKRLGKLYAGKTLPTFLDFFFVRVKVQ